MESKFEDAFCPHKEFIDAYCKKCGLYVCKECQMSQHYDHISELSGLDSIFTTATQEYTHMISTLDKQLISSRPKVHPGVVDDSLAEVTRKIRAGYDKIVGAAEDLKRQHLGVIKESPFLERLQREKTELEGEEMKRVETFDKKLGETMKRLLKAITEEDFTDVIPMLAGRVKEELAAEAAQLEPYYEQQGKFLKHLEILKSVKPAIEYDKDIVEDLIQVRGVHDDETLKMPIHCAKSNSVFIHIPVTRSILKKKVADVQLPLKAAQVFIQGTGLIIIGGRTIEGKYSNATYVYLLDKDMVSCRSNMLEPRAGHAVTSCRDNEVFVSGGFNEVDKMLSSVEMYDTNADLWKKLPSMVQKRKNHSLCMVSERYLYAMGGVLENMAETADIEMLDTVAGKGWELKSIKGAIPFQKAGVIEIEENKLLIFGGKYGKNKRKQAYVIDLITAAMNEDGILEAPEVFNNRSDYHKHAGHLYATSGKSVGITHIYHIKGYRWVQMNKEAYLLKYNWD